VIVGTYTLDLYCDCCRPYERRGTGTKRGPHPEQFVFKSERETMRQARKEGWTFRKGKCRCRACSNEARSFPKGDQ
jgi:hypothetical protein